MLQYAFESGPVCPMYHTQCSLYSMSHQAQGTLPWLMPFLLGVGQSKRLVLRSVGE